VVGAIFDGNIHSLGGDFGYDGRTNRAIAVLTPAISAALRHVYGLPALADELEAEAQVTAADGNRGGATLRRRGDATTAFFPANDSFP